MRLRAVLTTLAAGALVAGAAVPTQAGRTPTAQVVSSDVIAPFNLAVRGDDVYVADGFTAQLSRLTADGLVPAAEVVGAEEVAGVAVNTYGRLAWLQTNYTEGAGSLEVRGPKGYSLSADLWGFEETRNPDRGYEYGVRNPSQCVRDAFDAIGAPVEYTGIVESHPYSVAAGRNGSWYVADAAGNSLLSVDARGRIRTIAVLPLQPVRFTTDQVAALGLPECVAGVTYRFEPVPTDVEVGADGMLYVTTLPGGPEDPSLGARGALWKVDPATGRVTMVAGGFLGATNLAIGRDGSVYVAELFAGQVSRVRNGKVTPFVEVPNALSVETGRTGLWVGTLAPLGETGPEGPGTIVRVTW